MVPEISGHEPSDADAEEDVDSVGPGHVSDRVVGAVVLKVETSL